MLAAEGEPKMSQDPSCSELAAANLCLVSPRHTQLPSPLSTGLEMNNTKSFDILPEIYKVTFENTKDFYKRGIPYTGTVTGIPPQPCSPTPAPQLQPNPHISPPLADAAGRTWWLCPQGEAACALS